jgi:Cu-Zn family superoxide dismutase
VQIEPEGEGVKVRVETFSLPPGLHGIHVHEAGTCEAPAFTSAGDHFNPGGLPHHGSEGNHHAGDLPNLTVGADGTGRLEATLQGITLRGRGHHSLFHKGGTSIVIHRDADDMATAPSGNSGPRVACGVIQAVR